MANLKISQLTAVTENTIGSWVVINNSGETTSNKSQLEYVLGMTKGTGNSSIKSNDFLTELPSVSDSDYSIALGNGASASTAPSIVAIGNGAYSVSENCVVIGKNAHDQGTGRDNGIAIGTDAEIYQANAISIGKNAAGVGDAITIGTDGRGIATSCVSIGASNVVAGNYGVGIGYDIFQDRDNATVVGSQSYVSGINSTVVGASSLLGQTDGDAERSTIVGADNEITGLGDDSVLVGFSSVIGGFSNQIVIGNDIGSGANGALTISTATAENYSTNGLLIGGSGWTGGDMSGIQNVAIATYDSEFGASASKNSFYSCFNSLISATAENCSLISCSGVTISAGAFNTHAIGLTGRTISGSDAVHLPNLLIYQSIQYNQDTYNDAGTIVLNPYLDTQVIINATGGTYNIECAEGVPTTGLDLELYINYTSGATINFVAGARNFNFGSLGTPVFSGTNSNILIFRSVGTTRIAEVSRNMYIV